MNAFDDRIPAQRLTELADEDGNVVSITEFRARLTDESEREAARRARFSREADARARAHADHVRRNTPWLIRLFAAFVELAGKWSRGER